METDSLKQAIKEFKGLLKGKDGTKAILELLKKAPTYGNALEFSYISGLTLSEVLTALFNSGVLTLETPPSFLLGMLGENHRQVTSVCAYVQEAINANAGLRLQAVKPAFAKVNALGLVDKMRSYKDPMKAVWTLGEPVVSFSMRTVDESIRANADFHARAGLSPTLKRTAEPNCCEWCDSLAGSYDYPAPSDVYRRHGNCRCVTEYRPDKYRVQNSHTKKWRTGNN